MTSAFRSASHHSIIRELVKLKSPLVGKLSKTRLRFVIVIVQTKTEVVQNKHIVQSAARIIGETVSKLTRFVGFLSRRQYAGKCKKKKL